MSKYSACRLFASFFVPAICFSGMISCVDKDYEINDLDDISKEVTIATDGIEAPVLAPQRKTISELIGDEADEYLEVGRDGVYVLGYGDSITATIDDLAIDPITDFVPEMESQVVRLSADDVELPSAVRVKPVVSSFDFSIPEFDIKNSTTIPPINSVATVRVPDGFGAGIAVNPALVPQLSLSAHNRAEVSVSAELEDEVAYVKRVEFGATDAGELVTVYLDAGSLTPVCEGGTVESLTITFPAGYELGLADTYKGKAALSKSAGSQTDNVFTMSGYTFAASEPLRIELYMKYAELSPSLTAGGYLTVNDGVEYDLNFTMKTKAGTIASGKGPELGMEINPVFRDAIVVSKDIGFEVKDVKKDFDYDISGVSTDIMSVDYVALSGTNTVTLKASPLNLPFEGADFDVNVTLPQVFRFAPSPYIAEGNILSVPFSVLNQGVTLSLSGIDLSATGKGAVDENGVIGVHEQFMFNVSHTFPSATYRLSEIAGAMGKQTCDITVSTSELTIDRASCVFWLKSISSDLDVSEKFEYSLDLPSEIKRIDRLYIETVSGGRVSAEVKFSIKDSPVENIYVENLVITLPDVIMLSGEDVVDNRIEISGRQLPARETGEVLLSKFDITGLKNLPVSDGKIVIDDAVSFNGKVRTIDGELIDGLNGDVVITPVVSVPDIKAVKFEGAIDVDLNDYIDTPSVDLSDLTDKLSEISLGLSDPSISVTVSNPVGVALKGEIVMHPFDKQGNPMRDLTVGGIRIAGADDAGDAVTRLFITPVQGATMEGCDAYYVPELLELLRDLPSKIDFDLQVALDDTQTHTLFLDRDYEFVVDYKVNVPMRLDSSTRIAYSDTISLNDKLKDITDKNIKVETLELVLEVRSTVPLDLDLTAELKDELGAHVDGVDFRIDGRIGGYDPATDGTERVSTVSGRLKLRDGDVKWLDGVSDICVNVTGTSSSLVELKPEQYIDIRGYVRARRISIDLDEM